MTIGSHDAPAAERGAEALLDAVEEAIPALASRAGEIAITVFPEAAQWDELERRRLEHQAADRLTAILRLTRFGDAVQGPELDDLATAGAAAAAAGAPLPALLLPMRVSRDLMVQAAVQVAGEYGDGWSPALAVLLTKVLPVTDRLTDAVTRGYWRQVAEHGA